MPCYKPLPSIVGPAINVSTGKPVVRVLSRACWHDKRGRRQGYVPLPCGQCIGCRLERSRQWALRCMHEASQHSENMFLTLTYRPESLPQNGSLVKKHHQDFLKRYRFWLEHKKLRFFHCGEYGESGGRPHYHTLIFGHRFRDLIPAPCRSENDLFISPKLEELWGHGHCLIGDVTFESAAYVARYVTKKITGPDAYDHYNKINKQTGEVLQERIPEYVTMSRRPGVGATWFDRYTSDVFPRDEVALKRGDRYMMTRPPAYYSKLFERMDPDEMAAIKARRIAFAKLPEIAQHNTPRRLADREHIQLSKFKQLKRGYEK